jgi:hypothetical protein
MKKMTGFLAVLIMLMWANTIRADANGLVNGSFEADGRIDDITDDITDPNTLTGWDVNMPTGQFDGWVGDYWVTDGNWSLTLHSKAEAFEVGDIAYVWQDVYLSDVNQIFFDVHLDTSGENWNPALRSAVVMIDDTVVWESPKTGTDIRGEYLNQAIDVSNEDRRLHRFAIGIRADVKESGTSIEYYMDWDKIGFDLFCGGNGFLDGDFNRDCRVDVKDYCMLADKWLEEVELDSKYNLSNEGDVVGYGIIDFKDFVIFANGWETGSFEQLEGFTDLWLTNVPYDNEWNFYKGDDAAAYGVVNYADLAIFVQHWLESSLP